MTTSPTDCRVTRVFRSSILFLTAIGPHAMFKWSRDSSLALKLPASSALAAAKAHAAYVKPGEDGAYAVDANGCLLAPEREPVSQDHVSGAVHSFNTNRRGDDRPRLQRHLTALVGKGAYRPSEVEREHSEAQGPGKE